MNRFGLFVICGDFSRCRWQGELDEQIISGIDRVRRALSGTSITFVGIE